MNEQNEKLKQHLTDTLTELERLSAQIRQQHDLSEQAEFILCLRELVSEQIGPVNHENTDTTTHTVR